jgi:hypothetical protein
MPLPAAGLLNTQKQDWVVTNTALPRMAQLVPRNQ